MTIAVDRLRENWANPSGILGWLSAVGHKEIGRRYLVTSFLFFLAGGILALLIRVQLFVPSNTVLSPQAYNEIFTVHGTTMMLLFAVPMVEGFAIYLVPLMLGARDAPFPRLNAFGYWSFLFGGLLLYASFAVGTPPDGGWFSYTPLTGTTYSPTLGQDFWLLGVMLVEFSAIVFGIETIVAVVKLRAPGMSVSRIPLYVWYVSVVAGAILFAVPALLAGGVMLELDRLLGMSFFDTARGGNDLLWQHLFWIFGHPEVYIQFLGGIGIVSTVIPTFVRRPLIGYTFAALAIVMTGILSFGLWVHHMFAVGLPFVALGYFSAISLTIAIPTGFQFFLWITTIFRGRLVWNTTMRFAVGALVTFLIGGLTGPMIALVAFDWQVTDTFFIVAHFHYVLIGGMLFPFFAGFYYWFPKITGRLLDERLGWLNFWLMFIGFNLAFFPMHIAGLLGMPRRVYTYPVELGLQTLNQIETVGAFILGLGILVFIYNAIQSLAIGERSGPDPWQAGTLEWATPSPPPAYTWETIPTVHSAYPLWDDEDVTAQPLLAQPEPGLRETIGTSTLEGRPIAVHMLPSASIWPLVAALAATAALVGVLVGWSVLFAIGLAVAVVAAVGWLWPGERERAGWVPNRETPYGPLPVEVPATHTTGWWALLLFLLALGAGFLSLLGSYYYLASGAPQWPPAGIARPELTWPIIGYVLTLISAGPAMVAVRAVRRGASVRFRAALAASIALGAAALAVLIYVILSLGVSRSAHAYGSLLVTINAFVIVQVIVALLMSLYVLGRAVRDGFTARRYLAVQNAALYWVFVAVVAVLSFVTLYVVPYLM